MNITDLGRIILKVPSSFHLRFRLCVDCRCAKEEDETEEDGEMWVCSTKVKIWIPYV